MPTRRRISNPSYMSRYTAHPDWYNLDRMAKHAVVTTRTRWFGRGIFLGILLCAILNALSYFVRSGGWGGLLGASVGGEAIGFPFLLWQQGNAYGGYFVEYAALAWNTLFGVGLGAICGVATLTQLHLLNSVVAEAEAGAANQDRNPFQFSLRGMFVATLLAALLAAIGRTWAARPEVLAGIYLFGPSLLVVLAMIPRRISWQQRVAILIPATLIVIVVAMSVATAMKIEVDKVLLGIFVCWVPQTGIAAIAVTLAVITRHYRRSNALRCP